MSERFDGVDKEVMSAVGKVVDNLLNEDGSREIGFALFVFPTGGGERTAKYVSNCERMDMLKAIQEWLDQAKTKMN